MVECEANIETSFEHNNIPSELWSAMKQASTEKHFLKPALTCGYENRIGHVQNS